jgi:hypothetical protein
LDSCLNCNDHFQYLRPLVSEVLVSNRFKRDAPDFDINLVVDCEHKYSTRLHKYEDTIEGCHIFRAFVDGMHASYVIDRAHRLIFLRAFRNVKSYKKFMTNKKGILNMIAE